MSPAVLSIFANLLMLTVPVYVLVVYDKVLMSQNFNTLLWMSLLALTSMIFYIFFDALKKIILKRKAIENEYKDIKSILENLDIMAQENKSGNDLIFKDVKTITIFTQQFKSLAYDFPWILIFLFVIYLLHPLLGFVSIGITAMLVLMSYINLKQDADTDLLKVENFSSALIKRPNFVLDFNNKKHILKWWKEHYENLQNNKRSLKFLTNLGLSLHNSIKLGASLLIIGAGAYLVIIQEITPGAMIAASMISGRILGPADQIFRYLKERQQYKESQERLKRFKEVLKLFPSSEDKQVISNNAIKIKDGALFNKSGKLLLQLGNLNIPKNKTIAVSGESESGKTLLLEILGGRQILSKGNMFLSDLDVKTIDKSQITFSESGKNLFPGTFTQNIFGFDKNIPNNTYDDLLSRFNLKEFFSTLPKGLDTQVEEVPSYLMTSGIKSKLRMASCFNTEQTIKIIDDIEFGSDAKITEIVKTEILNEKKKGNTIIFSCHNRNMVDVADILIILENKSIKNVIDLESERKKTNGK
jgi:ABC-type protease/lipase transport system fused ATPase/permease subunit